MGRRRRIHCRVCITKCYAAPEFDWLTGIVEKDGISRGANDAGIRTHESLSTRARKDELKQLPSILASMQQARQEMEVECRLLRKEEVVMQQTLGVATAKLEALELESHALAQLGERQPICGKNTARSLRAPRSPNPHTDYASISGRLDLTAKMIASQAPCDVE